MSACTGAAKSSRGVWVDGVMLSKAAVLLGSLAFALLACVLLTLRNNTSGGCASLQQHPIGQRQAPRPPAADRTATAGPRPTDPAQHC
ncbi:hypothetical protein ACFPH6_25185 [Streptomyces xiangluensis]|uniref:Uncharacterized protein n=1 Tax=Streptomyces xiangluensis TaxID=2665720 RepID=A0ABV8YR67_9ACTN